MPEHRRRFSPPQRVVEVSESDRLGCTEPTVVLWRRFAEEGLADFRCLSQSIAGKISLAPPWPTFYPTSSFGSSTSFPVHRREPPIHRQEDEQRPASTSRSTPIG
ncbi:MAG TPA: hypothetical protein VHY21_10520 [Pseudonocardiaceae bacterium]|jgi:hypothetical protein|nr:hypothetical protein [Pseudonocardiaceae bacterium]